MHQYIRRATVVAALLVAVVATVLPYVSGQSTNPQATPNNSYGGTAYTPPVTWTPVTTYSSAQGAQPTTLSGVGPSLTPGPAVFSYDIPTATVLGLVPTSALASLAAAGMPTDATGAIQPGFDPNRMVCTIFQTTNANESVLTDWEFGVWYRSSIPMRLCVDRPQHLWLG